MALTDFMSDPQSKIEELTAQLQAAQAELVIAEKCLEQLRDESALRLLPSYCAGLVNEALAAIRKSKKEHKGDGLS